MWDLPGPGIEQILNHWTTRGALNINILKVHAVMSSSHCILTHPGLKPGVLPYTYAAPLVYCSPCLETPETWEDKKLAHS